MLECDTGEEYEFEGVCEGDEYEDEAAAGALGCWITGP